MQHIECFVVIVGVKVGFKQSACIVVGEDMLLASIAEGRGPSGRKMVSDCQCLVVVREENHSVGIVRERALGRILSSVINAMGMVHISLKINKNQHVSFAHFCEV